MTLLGHGLLALWNGVDPARADEYDLWHTREHVPERVAIPGMLSARRYVAGDGPLPRYLTLYDLENTEVLVSAPYRALLENPTEWSRSMRPSFRGFFRLACRPVARLGAGIGGALWATTLDRIDPEGAPALLADLLALPAVTAAQLSLVAPEIPAVPFRIGGDLPDYPADAVLTVESYDRDISMTAHAAIEACVRRSGIGATRTVWTHYALGYVVTPADLPGVVPMRRPA